MLRRHVAIIWLGLNASIHVRMLISKQNYCYYSCDWNDTASKMNLFLKSFSLLMVVFYISCILKDVKCILNWPLPIGTFQDKCKQTMKNKYSNKHN